MWCEQTPQAGQRACEAGPAHSYVTFTRALCISHLNVREAWPEQQCLDPFGRFLLRSWQIPSEGEQHRLCIKTLAFLSYPFTQILQHLPRQKGSLLKPPFLLPGCYFPAAPQTLRGLGEVSEETWVMRSCKRSRPPELVPSEWGWGIYSPPNAHTLFLSAVVVIVQRCEPSVLCQPETSDTGGEHFPVPCSLLLFWVPHLWTQGIFQLPCRVYWCHEFKCCGCSERGACSGGAKVCAAAIHPAGRHKPEPTTSAACAFLLAADLGPGGGGLTALCCLPPPS